VCLFVLPKWFIDTTGTGPFQDQIGFGRAPNTPQPVALHWWDRLFKWFETATAFAADPKWHLWTLNSPTPAGNEVSTDASNLLHIGGVIALESNLPKLASPLGAIPLQITSDFGPRPPDPFNPSASPWHVAIDFRAKDPLYVYPVLSGIVTYDRTGTLRAKCPDAKHLSEPLKKVTVLSNNQLEVSYLHLSEIITQSAGVLIGRSGQTGTCSPHLDVRMQFKDEFGGGPAYIDPWPLISNDVAKFARTTGDPIDTSACVGCREIFPFDFAVYVTEGKFIQPGVFLPFPGIEGNYGVFSFGQAQHVLTSAEGTLDLSKYPKEVTNGKYVVRITLCSDSIGGCRKVRDWKITTSTATCPDPAPNITATTQTIISGTTTKTQPGPISLSLSDNAASASASGTKGNISVSAIGSNQAGGSAISSIQYVETLMITSPGKSGGGQATGTLQVTGNVSSNAQINSAIWIGSPPIANGFYQNIGGTLYTQPMTVNFTYGSPLRFNFIIHATAGIASSASANAGYSITVSDDPNAKVSWCRATQ